MVRRTKSKTEIDYNEDPDKNWSHWAVHVIKTIERLDEEIDELYDNHNKVENEVSKLEIKSGIWGAAAGLIMVFILIFSNSLRQGSFKHSYNDPYITEEINKIINDAKIKQREIEHLHSIIKEMQQK